MTDIGEAIKGTILAALADLFRPIAHADCVYSCPPVWVRASGAEALFGLKRDCLRDLVAQKKVTAKVVKEGRVVLYKFADIVQAIDAMPSVKINKKGN